MKINCRIEVRWRICALLFFAATINYMDRQIVGILAPTLQTEIGWTESQYGLIVAAFTSAYAIGLLFSGRLLDWIGVKKGLGLSVFGWSLAAIGHALAATPIGFAIARMCLGLTEGGLFPSAIKAVAEWFPKKERSFATGILNSGTNIGVMTAALFVPILTLQYGWKMAFIIQGSIGFVWLLFLFPIYQKPSDILSNQEAVSKKLTDNLSHQEAVSKRLSGILSNQEAISKKLADNLSHQEAVSKRLSGILSNQEAVSKKLTDNLSHQETVSKRPLPLKILLLNKKVWAFIIGKGMTDPIWWFYLYWLPKYLTKDHGMTLSTLALPLIIIYVSADIGSIFGGWLSAWFIKNGRSHHDARKWALFLCAICVLPTILLPWVSQVSTAIFLISLAVAGHQGWSANLFNLPSDFFPHCSVGSLVGIGGFFGSIGGMLFQAATGYFLQWNGGNYAPIFFVCGMAYLAAWLIIQRLTAHSFYGVQHGLVTDLTF
jgi:MFS transporter, ACS family, aldohexuronate transporter